MNPPYIISASRRTDIPAFYSEWFIRRVRAGGLKVRHPFSQKELKISLNPEEVVGIVFWTKNFSPMFSHLKELEERGFFYLIHYTITGLGSSFEPRVPEPEKSIELFQKLAERVGKKRIFWRFDPIVITEKIGEEETLERFEKILVNLKNYTERVYFSFLELYARVKRRIKYYEKEHQDRVLEPTPAEKEKIAQRLKELAHRHGLSIYACCEPELVGFGIQQAHCIDARLVAELSGKNFPSKISPSRRFCGCYYSLDIGAYDTCPHLCWYCYANNHPQLVKKRYTQHRLEGEYLVE